MQNAVFTNIFVYLLYSLEISIIVIPFAYTHNLLLCVANIFPTILFIFNLMNFFLEIESHVRGQKNLYVSD